MTNILQVCIIIVQHVCIEKYTLVDINVRGGCNLRLVHTIYENCAN